MSVLVKEVGRLRGSYVNNVYSIGETQLVRFRQPGGEDQWVIVSPGFGAWVSNKVAERAETTPFTSSLRSAIARARLEGVTQVGLDRIFDFALASGQEERHLILELMPPGNLLVLGGDGRVMLSLREVKTPARRIVRGGRYTPPAQRRVDPESVQGPDMARFLEAEKTVGQALGRNLALPRRYVREALARLSLSEDSPASIEAPRSEGIAATVRGLIEESRARPHPCLAKTADGLEIFAVLPKSAEVVSESDLLSSICDEVLLPAVLEGLVGAPTRREQKRGELEATLEGLRRKERDMLSEATRLRGLAAGAAQLASAEEARAVLKDAGAKPPPGGVASPASVSSIIYNSAKELERKAAESRDAATMIAKRLSKERAPGQSPAAELRREKREWYERFRWFFTTGGRLAIGGRDAQSNSLLVRRHLDGNDVVYHADLFGSPFFVLKGGSAQTPEEQAELAQATVSFSSAWKTGLSAADAFWVTPEQVGKSAPSGEYLAKGSFMILGRKNAIRRVLVELAVGVDESGRVVAGPEAAVAAHSRGYVILAPHREKPSETAKKIVKELEPLGLRRGTSVDEVVRALPAGGGKIVRRKLPKPQGPDNV